VLDALRQPLEEWLVRVSRARASVTFPARVLLVAAMAGSSAAGTSTPRTLTHQRPSSRRTVMALGVPRHGRWHLTFTSVVRVLVWST
jgi:magnesium chelatase family protein